MANSPKSASVVTYLIEELSDARIRCDQLVKYITEAVKLVDKSSKKDHFFEAAGHLIEGIPATAFKLEKALQAVALAASKLDYEELKQELRPEKVQQLEKVLEEVRIRPVHRRSEPIMDVQQAIEALHKLAQQTRSSGNFPTAEALDIISDLEVGLKTAGESADPATVLDRIASALSAATPGQRLSRGRLAGLLRKLTAEEMMSEALSEESLVKKADEEMLPPEALVEEMLSTMKAVARSAGVGRWRVALLHLTGIVEGIGNLLAQMGTEGALVKTKALTRDVMQTARMAQRMRPEDAVLAGDKTAADPLRAMERMVDTMEDQLKEMKHSLGLYQKDPEKYAPQVQNFAAAAHSVMISGRILDRALSTYLTGDYYRKYGSEEETKESRFEEGKPADPTKQMTPEDAKKWKVEHEKNKDNFKGASDPWKVEAAEDEEKEARFEEGKPADPTKEMSPEDAKKWKSNTEEYGDKFKAAASSMSVGEWYMQSFQTSGDIYFYAQEQLKNKGFKGLMVAIGDSGRAQKAKKDSVSNFNLWKEVPESKVPSDVKSKAKARMASEDPWKASSSEDEEKQSRFEEGKPADPTTQMSPEDAKKWKAENEKHKDEFKAASEDPWKA